MRIAVVQRKQSSYAMAIVAAFIVLAVAVPVSATPLLPGLTVPVLLFTDDPGTLVTTPAPPPPVLASAVNPISAAYTGTLITAVYRDATGRLEFDYQFSNNGPDDVHRITAFNFTGFATDVGFRLVPAGLPSVFATPTPVAALPPVFADRDPDGSTVGFEFGPGLGNINAGETSVILAIKTDASDRTDGFASVIDGGALTVPAFQPTGTPIPPADVPEPATLLLVGAAVIGMGLTVRRRSQR